MMSFINSGSSNLNLISSFILISILLILHQSTPISAIDQPSSQVILIPDNNHLSMIKQSYNPSQDGTGELSDWARRTKKQFFEDVTENQADQWVIVMGNEAGDTDSMAAAIAWAYHLSHLRTNPQKAIALLQTVEDALDLRPENQLALNRSLMSSRHRDLLTIDELPIKPFELSRHLNGIVLVDHNMPTAGWIHAPLLSIIDHHVDRHFNTSASPRVLANAASCSSLVAQLILDSNEIIKPDDENDDEDHHHQEEKQEGYIVPKELIELLMRAMALDSSGLDPRDSFEVDQESSDRLFKLRQKLMIKEDHQKKDQRALKKLMTEFWVEMADARSNLDSLDLRDLFRRDWKSNSIKTQSDRYPYLSVGFASIPASLEEQIERTPEKTVPEWFAIERAFTSEIGADVSVVISKLKDPQTGEKQRELVIVVAHGWGKRLTTNSANDLFKMLCETIELNLNDDSIEWKRPDGKPILARRKVWKIIKHPIGRKFIMPLIQDAVSNWNWNQD